LEDKLSATVNKLTTTSESLSTLTKEHEDLHQKFTTSTSQNESMISELKTIVTDYQTEIKNYEKEVFNLKSKHKSSLVKIDEINKKLQVVTRARNNSVQSENKYKKANIETNERYQALLERAMGLIESDSNKNVQLQYLTADNVRLSKKAGKEILKPETKKALDIAQENVKYASKKRILKARQAILTPSSRLKTADDVRNLGFMNNPTHDIKIEAYRPDSANGKLWDITRGMAGYMRQSHLRSIPGSGASNPRYEFI